MSARRQSLALLLVALSALPGCDSPGRKSSAATAVAATPPRHLGLAPSGVSDEYRLREEIKAESMSAFLAGDFARLEALAAGYDENARTPSGLWKRSFFYTGIHDVFEQVPARDDATWAQLDERLQQWTQAYPQSPVPRLLRADAHVFRAFGYRGTRYAPNVDAKAWEPFHAHVEAARRQLEEDKAVASADPHWYQQMANVAKLQGWPRERYAAFEAEALDKAAHYYETVFALAGPYERRWGGTAKDMEAYAQRVLARTRAREGEGMYARLYWAELSNGEHIEGYDLDWPTMSRGIDDVLERYPDDWNLNWFARFACQAGDGSKSASLIAKLHGLPLKAAWGQQAAFDTCQAGLAR